MAPRTWNLRTPQPFTLRDPPFTKPMRPHVALLTRQRPFPLILSPDPPKPRQTRGDPGGSLSKDERSDTAS